MIRHRHTAPWLRWIFPIWFAVAMLATPQVVRAGRSNEPEPQSQQQHLTKPLPSPVLEMDSAMLALQPTVEDQVAAQGDSTVKTPPARPVPASGEPQSKGAWPGIVALSMEGGAILIIALALMLIPFAVEGFIGLALLIAYIGHFFGLVGMKPEHKGRNLALLACAIWGLFRAIIAVYFVAAFALLALWF